MHSEDSDPTGRVHAQADPSLRWVHMSFCGFCRVAGHFFFFFFFFFVVVVVLQYSWINFELSVSVDVTFYGATIGMDQATQA